MRRVLATVLFLIMIVTVVGCSLEIKNTSSSDTVVFDQEKVLTQLEVTEYSYSFGIFQDSFLVVKNNSEFTLQITAGMKFLNGTESIMETIVEANAVEPGTETVLWTIPPEEFTSLDYKLTVEEETFYSGVVSNLSYETTSEKGNEILSVKNNGENAAENVTGYILFFSGDKLVDFERLLFTVSEDKLEPGATMSHELSSRAEYDNIKVYFSGRSYKYN